jgi:hypothetical protein
MVLKVGYRWSIIAKEFKGRTCHMIKNRYKMLVNAKRKVDTKTVNDSRQIEKIILRQLKRNIERNIERNLVQYDKNREEEDS